MAVPLLLHIIISVRSALYFVPPTGEQFVTLSPMQFGMKVYTKIWPVDLMLILNGRPCDGPIPHLKTSIACLSRIQ
jgi:hypothetical protein